MSNNQNRSKHTPVHNIKEMIHIHLQSVHCICNAMYNEWFPCNL